MGQDDLVAYQRNDPTWHRPTWRFGTCGSDEPSAFRDPFGFFADGPAGRAGGPDDEAAREPLSRLLGRLPRVTRHPCGSQLVLNL